RRYRERPWPRIDEASRAIPRRILPRPERACKRTIIQCVKAVNQDVCATQYHPYGRCIRAAVQVTIARSCGQSRKSYWGSFHRNVTVRQAHGLIRPRRSAHGRASFATTIWGNTKDGDNDGNI